MTNSIFFGAAVVAENQTGFLDMLFSSDSSTTLTASEDTGESKMKLTRAKARGF